MADIITAPVRYRASLSLLIQAFTMILSICTNTASHKLTIMRPVMGGEKNLPAGLTSHHVIMAENFPEYLPFRVHTNVAMAKCPGHSICFSSYNLYHYRDH